MTIMITGGAGFMGSHFVKYILNNYPDYRVIVFDKLTYAGNLDNLKEAEGNANYRFVHGDICDKEKVNQTVREYQVDVIVNYAAETHVDRSILDPDAFLRTDVLGIFNLLEAVRANGVERMVQISTDEVFGSVHRGLFTEESPFAPNSPYAASKAGGDLLIRSYVVTYKTPVVVTHSCNLFGPNQYPEKVIPLFVTNIIEGKKVPVYGDGQQSREWIHVSDHCRAIDAMVHKAEPGSVYNIGTGNEVKNLDLTRKILALLGAHDDMIEHVVDRPGHDRRYAIDWSKIKRELGWEPLKSFDVGLAETVAWYQENEAWWKKIKSGEYLEYYKKQYKV